jgi:hypothetical protein
VDPNLSESIAKMRMDELRREAERYRLARQVKVAGAAGDPGTRPRPLRKTNAFTEERADAPSPEAEEMQREEATRGA